MARGWESKSVESQMEDREERRPRGQPAPLTAEEIRVLDERALLESRRMRTLLDLEAAKHPRHREQLQAAIAHLDERLRELK